jgi:hypothetical protein
MNMPKIQMKFYLVDNKKTDKQVLSQITKQHQSILEKNPQSSVTVVSYLDICTHKNHKNTETCRMSNF